MEMVQVYDFDMTVSEYERFMAQIHEAWAQMSEEDRECFYDGSYEEFEESYMYEALYGDD